MVKMDQMTLQIYFKWKKTSNELNKPECFCYNLKKSKKDKRIRFNKLGTKNTRKVLN